MSEETTALLKGLFPGGEFFVEPRGSNHAVLLRYDESLWADRNAVEAILHHPGFLGIEMDRMCGDFGFKFKGEA